MQLQSHRSLPLGPIQCVNQQGEVYFNSLKGFGQLLYVGTEFIEALNNPLRKELSSLNGLWRLYVI